MQACAGAVADGTSQGAEGAQGDLGGLSLESLRRAAPDVAEVAARRPADDAARVALVEQLQERGEGLVAQGRSFGLGTGCEPFAAAGLALQDLGACADRVAADALPVTLGEACPEPVARLRDVTDALSGALS